VIAKGLVRLDVMIVCSQRWGILAVHTRVVNLVPPAKLWMPPMTMLDDVAYTLAARENCKAIFFGRIDFDSNVKIADHYHVEGDSEAGRKSISTSCSDCEIVDRTVKSKDPMVRSLDQPHQC
jgi:hypothetical protein